MPPHRHRRFAAAYISCRRKTAENALALATHRKFSSDADGKASRLFARPPFKVV